MPGRKRGGTRVRMRLWLGLVVAVAMAAIVLFTVRSPGALTTPVLFQQPTGRTARAGQPAPPFTLPALGLRQAVSLAPRPGTVTVLNFWATWCRYCRKELPLLNRTALASGGKVRVFGIDYTSQETSVAAVAAFVKRLRVAYPVLLDETGTTFHQYGVHAYPTTFFLNGQGVVTGVVIGQLTPDILRLEFAEAGVHVALPASSASARASA